MEDRLIDIVNRSCCYEDFSESSVIKYKYCAFSEKAKSKDNTVMLEECAKIKEELLKCKNINK